MNYSKIFKRKINRGSRGQVKCSFEKGAVYLRTNTIYISAQTAKTLEKFYPGKKKKNTPNAILDTRNAILRSLRKTIPTNFLFFSPKERQRWEKKQQKNCKTSWKCRIQLQKLLYTVFARSLVNFFSSFENEETNNFFPRAYSSSKCPFGLAEWSWSNTVRLN